MRESAERLEKKLQDITERHLDDMQKTMLRFNEYAITKKNEETTSTIPTNNIINDIITIATTTGTTSTTLPTVELNLLTDTTTNNNNNNSNSNNIVESIVNVEDDDYYSNSDDDAFLSSEDYDFVSSIQSSAFIGIYLPPLLWNACDNSSLGTTILTKLDNNICQFECFLTASRRSNFLELLLFHLM